MIFSFFLRKSLQVQFNFWRFDFSFLFKFSSFLLLKGSQTPLSNSKCVKVKKNVIDFLFRKWKIIIRFPRKVKVICIKSVNLKLFYKFKEL